ncbi:hypothetical protein HDV00_006553 [Rhizophlyctis rosea]|nr:hypothetical protein HDV00_006553 [Rhizophlyctis rosea]
MEEFKYYLQIMSEAEYNELLPLPSLPGGETEMFSFFGYYYGATLFNSTGRCGLLDGKAATALEETLVYWTKTQGVLQPRVVYPESQAAFDTWKTQPLLANPLDEPLFLMGDTHTWSFSDPTKKPQPGFSFENGFGNDLVKIYPPTGTGEVSAMLVGLYSENEFRNSTKAYHALLHAIAFNDRLHVYDPFVKDNGPQGGVSGYRSAKYTPEYIGQGDTRAFYTNIMDQVMFMGYPVPQYASIGLLEKYNPIQLMFNEIMFKNVSVQQALERACVIVNYATRPPCDASNWHVKLRPDYMRNKADVVYVWNEDKEEACQDGLYSAKVLPDELMGAISLPTISIQSAMAQSMIGLASVGICIEVILAALVFWNRRTRDPDFHFGPLAYGGWRKCWGQTIQYTLQIVIIIGEAFLCMLYQFWTIEGSNWRKVDLKLNSLSVTVEDCKRSADAAVYLLYIYNALLIVLAATYAFRTRNTISAFNENVFTVIAIGLICVISIIIVPVIQIVESPDAVFLLISLGTIVGALLSTLTFAVPKILIALGILAGGDVSQQLQVGMMNKHSGEKKSKSQLGYMSKPSFVATGISDENYGLSSDASGTVLKTVGTELDAHKQSRRGMRRIQKSMMIGHEFQ